MTDTYPLSKSDIQVKLLYLDESLRTNIQEIQHMRDTMSEEHLRMNYPTTDDLLICAKHFMEYALDTVKDIQRRFKNEY